MLRLAPMSEEDFAEYLTRSTDEFARGAVIARGVSYDQALEGARNYIQKNAFSQGLHTPGQFLFNIEVADGRVGYLHFGEAKNSNAGEVFGWDIMIFDEFRGQGLGRLAMIEASRILAEKGYSSIKLHVWGHNDHAVKLYQEMGFHITEMTMSTSIPGLRQLDLIQRKVDRPTARHPDITNSLNLQ